MKVTATQQIEVTLTLTDDEYRTLRNVFEDSQMYGKYGIFNDELLHRLRKATKEFE